MQVTRKSQYSGKTHTKEIDCTPEQLARYEAGGVLVQDVFPHLSPDDREFIMTGVLAEEWNEMLLMRKSVETNNIAASAIRQALRREFGARKYRIARDGEIHVYGPMPNAPRIVGWRLYGHVSDQQTLCNLGVDT